MQPIRELLDRVRWDSSFEGEFDIAFVDHTKPELQRISVRDMQFDAVDHFSFRCLDADGELVCVPLHRIREVYRDGKLIWSRPGAGSG